MLLLRSIYAFLPTGISTAIDVKYETCFSISMDCRDQCPEHVIPSSSMGKNKSIYMTEHHTFPLLFVHYLLNQ